jgi:hypothetical protein
MSVRMEEYLDLERMLTSKLQFEMADTVQSAWDRHSKALAMGDLEGASVQAETLTLEAVAPKVSQYAAALMRAAIDFGAIMASNSEKTLTSSLSLQRTVQHNVGQLCQFLKYRGSAILQGRLLQSIAQHREASIQKADAVRGQVSFMDDANAMAQMISGLHTSRLSGWGFTAEADMLGITTYKLSAQLDKRTSRFCRFIHGKTFSVVSAKRILDLAVFADNPEDLKVLHPWPNQNLESIASYEAMTSQQLQDAGMGVPPFHPGCRTLMVRVDYKTRLVKPKVSRSPYTLPDYTSTPETFLNMGIRLSKEKVAVWNDYMNVDPLVLLSTLSRTAIPNLLGNSTGMINVTRANDILLAWGADKALKVLFRTGTGALELSPKLVDTMLTSGEWEILKNTYSSFGASSALAIARQGEAMALSEAGFIPDLGGWSKVQAEIRVSLDALPKGSLTGDQEAGVRSILLSTNPAALKQLHTLGIKTSVLKQLLEKVAYRGTFSFDETGLS